MQRQAKIKHRIITVERGGGYAARCEVEVADGVHICGITFGGFRTRTDARSALTHDYERSSR